MTRKEIYLCWDRPDQRLGHIEVVDDGFLVSPRSWVLGAHTVISLRLVSVFAPHQCVSTAVTFHNLLGENRIHSLAGLCCCDSGNYFIDLHEYTRSHAAHSLKRRDLQVLKNLLRQKNHSLGTLLAAGTVSHCSGG